MRKYVNIHFVEFSFFLVCLFFTFFPFFRFLLCFVFLFTSFLFACILGVFLCLFPLSQRLLPSSPFLFEPLRRLKIINPLSALVLKEPLLELRCTDICFTPNESH